MFIKGTMTKERYRKTLEGQLLPTALGKWYLLIKFKFVFTFVLFTGFII